VAYSLAQPRTLNTQLSVPGGSALQVRVPITAQLLCLVKVVLAWLIEQHGLLIFAISSGDARCVSGTGLMVSRHTAGSYP
jgi:hypothetical protein